MLMRLVADDYVVINREISNQYDISSLQTDINNISKWRET